MLSRNVEIQSSGDPVPCIRRAETSTAPLQKPATRTIWVNIYEIRINTPNTGVKLSGFPCHSCHDPEIIRPLPTVLVLTSSTR